MQQYLHLLVVDHRRHSALIQVVGRRWMLPVVACPERARAPLVAAHWVAVRQLAGVVAGQWLGRIAPDERSIDWLIAIAVGSPLERPPLSWASIDDLEASKATVDYQAFAVEHVAARGGIHVCGPFGSLDWIDGARSWIESTGLTGISSVSCFRASANDVVLSVRSESVPVYFKGVASERADDVRAMAAAASSCTDSFPRTRALDESADATRWLVESCAGVPLARCRGRDAVVRVACDIGRVQRMIGSASPPSPLSLPDIVDAAESLLEAAGMPWPSRAMRQSFGDVVSLPHGWTPLDLDPSNVFVDGAHVSYIDLEPRTTVMPIALSVLARRLHATGELLRALRRAYESTLQERVPWQSVDRVSAVTELVMGWKRLLRNVEGGEVRGPLDRVERAVAKRLASVLPLV